MMKPLSFHSRSLLQLNPVPAMLRSQKACFAGYLRPCSDGRLESLCHVMNTFCESHQDSYSNKFERRVSSCVGRIAFRTLSIQKSDEKSQ